MSNRTILWRGLTFVEKSECTWVHEESHLMFSTIEGAEPEPAFANKLGVRFSSLDELFNDIITLHRLLPPVATPPPAHLVALLHDLEYLTRAGGRMYCSTGADTHGEGVRKMQRLVGELLNAYISAESKVQGA